VVNNLRVGNDKAMDTQSPLIDRDVFEDEVFSNQELPHADLSGKEFVRCTFRKMVLQETVWKGARLDDCVFDACDLARMRPAKMAAHGIEFLNCRMVGIDWSEVGSNPTITFEGCNLQYASFVNVNLTGTRFTHCKLLEVNFIETRLMDAEFTDSDLSGSRFEDCDLRKANFADTQGLSLDPVRNKVKDTRISVASAVLLAVSFGMRVSGFDDDPADRSARRGK